VVLRAGYAKPPTWPRLPSRRHILDECVFIAVAEGVLANHIWYRPTCPEATRMGLRWTHRIEHSWKALLTPGMGRWAKVPISVKKDESVLDLFRD